MHHAKPDLAGLLKNVIYTGKIHYHGQRYAGEHAALVEEPIWQRVQDLLREKQKVTRR